MDPGPVQGTDAASEDPAAPTPEAVDVLHKRCNPIVPPLTRRAWMALACCDHVYAQYQHSQTVGMTAAASAALSGPCNAYAEWPDAGEFSAGFSWAAHHALSSSDTAFVHYFGVFEHAAAKRLVFCTMGSVTLGDWASDLAAWADMSTPVKAAGAPGKAHAGFTARIAALPVGTLVSRLNDGWEVTVCGHSLGGAVANLVGHQLVASPAADVGAWLADDRLAVVTFAAPLIGDARMQQVAAAQTARTHHLFHHFVNANDVVPRVCALAADVWGAAIKAGTGAARAYALENITASVGTAAAGAVIGAMKTVLGAAVPQYAASGVWHFMRRDVAGTAALLTVPAPGMAVVGVAAGGAGADGAGVGTAPLDREFAAAFTLRVADMGVHNLQEHCLGLYGTSLRHCLPMPLPARSDGAGVAAGAGAAGGPPAALAFSRVPARWSAAVDASLTTASRRTQDRTTSPAEVVVAVRGSALDLARRVLVLPHAPGSAGTPVVGAVASKSSSCLVVRVPAGAGGVVAADGTSIRLVTEPLLCGGAVTETHVRVATQDHSARARIASVPPDHLLFTACLLRLGRRLVHPSARGGDTPTWDRAPYDEGLVPLMEALPDLVARAPEAAAAAGGGDASKVAQEEQLLARYLAGSKVSRAALSLDTVHALLGSEARPGVLLGAIEDVAHSRRAAGSGGSTDAQLLKAVEEVRRDGPILHVTAAAVGDIAPLVPDDASNAPTFPALVVRGGLDEAGDWRWVEAQCDAGDMPGVARTRLLMSALAGCELAAVVMCRQALEFRAYTATAEVGFLLLVPFLPFMVAHHAGSHVVSSVRKAVGASSAREAVGEVGHALIGAMGVIASPLAAPALLVAVANDLISDAWHRGDKHSIMRGLWPRYVAQLYAAVKVGVRRHADPAAAALLGAHEMEAELVALFGAGVRAALPARPTRQHLINAFSTSIVPKLRFTGGESDDTRLGTVRTLLFMDHIGALRRALVSACVVTVQGPQNAGKSSLCEAITGCDTRSTELNTSFPNVLPTRVAAGDRVAAVTLVDFPALDDTQRVYAGLGRVLQGVAAASVVIFRLEQGSSDTARQLVQEACTHDAPSRLLVLFNLRDEFGNYLRERRRGGSGALHPPADGAGGIRNATAIAAESRRLGDGGVLTAEQEQAARRGAAGDVADKLLGCIASLTAMVPAGIAPCFQAVVANAVASNAAPEEVECNMDLVSAELATPRVQELIRRALARDPTWSGDGGMHAAQRESARLRALDIGTVTPASAGSPPEASSGWLSAAWAAAGSWACCWRVRRHRPHAASPSLLTPDEALRQPPLRVWYGVDVMEWLVAAHAAWLAEPGLPRAGAGV